MKKNIENFTNFINKKLSIIKNAMSNIVTIEEEVNMEFCVKFKLADHLCENEIEIANAVNDGEFHEVILTTNALFVEKDKKDSRYINTIKAVKIVYQVSGGGCIILRGHIGCSYREPFGGEYYVTKATLDPILKFKSIDGVVAKMKFTNYPMQNPSMQSNLANLMEDPKFVFNLSQFDEFMEIFEFYKKLSGELNNNVTYRINKISNPFYFVGVDVKDLEVEESNAIRDGNNVIIGYKIDDYIYGRLSSEDQDKTRRLVNIDFAGSEKDFKKIRSFRENLYLSNDKEVNDYNSRQIKNIDLINTVIDGDNIVLTAELDKISNYDFLHLYDMGQKVKLESIDNSLRLINQGASGSAVQLLEYIIGSTSMPSKRHILSANDKRKDYTEGLDKSQKQAFLMATDGMPVSLIKGPPGTGKTHVINAIVQYITKELKEKVVISSQTHVAIDNVLDKLMENYDLIIPNRITNKRNKYSESEIDTTLYKTWAKNFSSHNGRSSNKKLSQAIELDMKGFAGDKRFIFSESILSSEYSVLGATTTTSAIGGKKGLELLDGYDWLIIDEVSKCPITEVLRYLPYVKKIIMVGDDFQLAPLLEFTKDDVKELPSYDEDKFERLRKIYEQSVFADTLSKAQSAGRLVMLNVNYRSVKKVLNTYNIFYDGKLESKREIVNPSKVEFTNKYPTFNESDVFFVDVKFGKEAKQNTSRYNIEELNATAEILKDLIENTLNPSKVAVSAIFPYAAQIEKFQFMFVNLINNAKKVFKSFEIDTVDAFQGKETDIVLVNTVVTDPSQKNFLNDFRRINVSMSRAKDKLFIFGNPSTLAKIEMKVLGGNKRRYFAEIIDDIKRFGTIITYEGGVKHEATSKPKIKVI